MGSPSEICLGCDADAAFISTFLLLPFDTPVTLSVTVSCAIIPTTAVKLRRIVDSRFAFIYLMRLPRMSRVSSLVTERVAALVAFFTTRPVAEVFDLVFLPVTLSLT